MAEALTAGQAARLVGVAITTLRTWDRRYGLGPSGHESGKHRRYREEDLRRLAEMRRLTADGMPPAQAAAWILDRRVLPNRRAGGGYAVAVGDAGPAVRGLTRAAMRLDAAELRRTISATLAADGVVSTWTDLLAPALIHIGRKHAATQAVIEVEHLLSVEISLALASIPRPDGPARVLLACTDEEQHSLALEAVAAALAERGTPTRQLGARVPPDALRQALRRTGPDVVMLWSQTSQTAHRRQLSDVLDSRPAPKLVLAGGPGWTQVPAGAHKPADLGETITLIPESSPS